MTTVELQPAFVLHSRDYRDTSLIVDFLTPDYGRLSAVARGARGRKGRSSVKQLLAPFQALLISCQGKGELKTLTGIEAAGAPVFLNGNILYSGFYINELLMRLLLPMDAHPAIYAAYQRALAELTALNSVGADTADLPLEPVLREFELALLEALGYGLEFCVDGESGAPIARDSLYYFAPESGFICCDGDIYRQRQPGVFSGELLYRIGQREFSTIEVRRAAKQLLRLALKPLLGTKPLKSRELFRPVQRSTAQGDSP